MLYPSLYLYLMSVKEHRCLIKLVDPRRNALEASRGHVGGEQPFNNYTTNLLVAVQLFTFHCFGM